MRYLNGLRVGSICLLVLLCGCARTYNPYFFVCEKDNKILALKHKGGGLYFHEDFDMIYDSNENKFIALEPKPIYEDPKRKTINVPGFGDVGVIE